MDGVAPRPIRRARLRDGIELLRTLGGRATELPPANLFPEGADVTKWSALGRTYVVTRSPEHVEQVFVGGDETYRKATHYRLLATVTGDGLLTSEGEAWAAQRRLIQPVLGRRQIDGLIAPMVEATRGYLDRFTPPAPPQTVRLGDEMTEVTLDVVGRALFGGGLAQHIDRLRPAVSRGMAIALVAARLQMILGFTRGMIDAGGRLVRRFPLPPPMHRIRGVMATFDDVVTEMIEQREREGTGHHHDLLDLLLTVTAEDGTPMSRSLVRDELVTMMLAGHETTANALSWLWYLLTQHPEAYERHLDEVRTVLGDRDPGPEDLDRLVWTRACLQEAMRLYPPAWVLEREARVATDLGGFRVPRKATVIFLVHLIHRDARWWDEPEAFRPERFLPGAPHPARGTYLPFGAGRRICVASSFALTEGTLIAAMISQRHRFERPDPGPPGESATVTLRPADRLPVVVRPARGAEGSSGATAPSASVARDPARRTPGGAQ
jgi:cytochrome P450